MSRLAWYYANWLCWASGVDLLRNGSRLISYVSITLRSTADMLMLVWASSMSSCASLSRSRHQCDSYEISRDWHNAIFCRLRRAWCFFGRAILHLSGLFHCWAMYGKQLIVSQIYVICTQLFFVLVSRFFYNKNSFLSCILIFCFIVVIIYWRSLHLGVVTHLSSY